MIGPTDYLWAVNPYGEIYRCKAPCKDVRWEKINGSLAQIDVGKEYVYGTNWSNQMFRCKLPCDTSAWEYIDGVAMNISG